MDGASNMQNLTLKMQASTATIIPNYFLDIYMPKSSGEFIKVYLCLLRSASDASFPLSVSALADKLNNTEKDILRALKYWESEHLLALTYDTYNNLTGIEFTSPGQMQNNGQAETPVTPAATITAPADISIRKITIPDKPSYSRDIIDKLTGSEDFSNLLYIAQSYIGKPLSSSDTNTLIYINTTLNFCAELTEYLIEYCVSLGHKSFSYIEKVAISWAEQGINSVDEAKAVSNFYKKECFQVLKAFGLNKRNPVDREIALINKWSKEYDFSMAIILEACNRTMQAIHQPSFEYADSILTKWHKAGVKRLNDISVLDNNYSRSKASESLKTQQPAAKPITNKFNNMPSRSYIYDDLEKQLLNQ